MKYLIMIVLLFSCSQAAALGYMPGSKLLEGCEAYLSEPGFVARGSTCFGFVTGISDAHDNFVVWDKMSPLWCSPDNVAASQLIRIVTKHLQEHPEILHDAASSQVLNALITAFPCE